MAAETEVLKEFLTVFGFRTDTAALRGLEGRVDSLQHRLNAASKAFTAAGGVMVGALVGVGRGFAKIEAKWSEVSAKTGISAQKLRDDYEAAAISISDETGIATDRIQDGFQKALSAGVTGAEAISLVGLAAKAEAAGIGALTDQISAATTIVETFGIDAGAALDIIARAAQVGEGETADFASSLKGLAAIAPTLDLEFTDVAGALAAASQVTKSVSVAETQMLSFLRSIQSQSADAVKALAEATGGDATWDEIRDVLAGGGMADAVKLLQDIIGDNNQILARMFSREEAQAFFNTADPQKIRDLGGAASDAGGTIITAFGQGAQDVMRQYERTVASAKNAIYELGKELKGGLVDGIETVREAIRWFRDLDVETKRLIASALLLGPAFLGVGFALKGVSVALGGLAPALKAGRTALKLYRRGWVAAAATVRAATLAMQGDVTLAMGRIGRNLKIGGAKGALIGEFDLIRRKGKGAFSALGLAGRGAFGTILRTAGRALLGVTRFIPHVAAITTAATLIMVAWRPLQAFFASLWEGLTESLAGVFDAFEPLAQLWDGIREAIGLNKTEFEGWASAGVAAGQAIGIVIRALLLPFEALAGVASMVGEALGLIGEEDAAANRAERARRREHYDARRGLAEAEKQVRNRPGDAGAAAELEAARQRLEAAEADAESSRAERERKREGRQAGGSPAQFGEPAGESLVDTMAAGVDSEAGRLPAAVESVAERTAEYLPSSDAMRGPFSRLSDSGRALVETFMSGVRDAGEIDLPISDQLRLALSGDPGSDAASLIESFTAGVRDASGLTGPDQPQLDLGGAGPASLQLAPAAVAAAGAPLAPSTSRTFNVQIDRIDIHAEGGDPELIGSKVADSLREQLHNLVEDHDSSVLR